MNDPALEFQSLELLCLNGNGIADHTAGNHLALRIVARSVFHNDGITARLHCLTDLIAASLALRLRRTVCRCIRREVNDPARHLMSLWNALFIAARLFTVIPVVGYIRAEHLDLLSIDHGIHAGADEVAGSILLDVPNPLAFACNVNILVPRIEYVLVGRLLDLAGGAGRAVFLLAIRSLLTNSIFGRSKGALIFAVAVGLLIDGGAPLLIGIRKRLFRAAGLALLPVAALVIPHNILALVRIEILILDKFKYMKLHLVCFRKQNIRKIVNILPVIFGC